MDTKSNTAVPDSGNEVYLRMLAESARAARRSAQRVLCVDDDAAVLGACASAFAGRSDWSFAVTAEAGLIAMESCGPHTVVIWSLEMVGGLIRLGDVRKVAPCSMVLLLSRDPSAPASLDAALRTGAAKVLPRVCPAVQLRRAVEEATASVPSRRMA